MIDETDISREQKWFYQERARIAVDYLNKRNINAQRVSDRKEALSVILEMIPEKAVVARGDSITMEQIGVIPALMKRNQKMIDPFLRDDEGHYFYGPDAEHVRLQTEALHSDVFLTGTNAVTLDGRLVNVDGRGNRVAAMVFGPKKVIIAVGANKIVKDLDEAMQRIHQYAAPLNAKRHFLKHHREEFGTVPCVRTGKCVDCYHEWRLCRYTMIIEGSMVRDRGRINVVLVEEELGL